MKFLYKLINYFRNQYNLCPVCIGDKYLKATRYDNNLLPCSNFTKCYIDATGFIKIKCPECYGRGIVFY